MVQGPLPSRQRLISGIKLDINLKKIVTEITNKLMENPTWGQLTENTLNFMFICKNQFI
jgi:hypothetical protein